MTCYGFVESVIALSCCVPEGKKERMEGREEGQKGEWEEGRKEERKEDEKGKQGRMEGRKKVRQ